MTTRHLEARQHRLTPRTPLTARGQLAAVHRRGVAASALAGLGLALLPKCPLCVAAYLTAFGVATGTAAIFARWARPLAWLVLAGSLGAWLLACLARARARARRRTEPSCACCF